MSNKLYPRLNLEAAGHALTQQYNKLMLIEKLAATSLFTSEQKRAELRDLCNLVLENIPVIAETPTTEQCCGRCDGVNDLCINDQDYSL